MAVPGPISSAMSAGCHDLLREGTAVAVGSVHEVLESCGPVGTALDPRERVPARPTDGLGDQALRVHEALGTPHRARV